MSEMEDMLGAAFKEFDLVPLMYPDIVVNERVIFPDTFFITADRDKMLITVSKRDESNNIHMTNYYVTAEDDELAIYEKNVMVNPEDFINGAS